ncbi:crotonase/enoyl-CoA hydratase family protein [Pseudomonas sp. BF-R-19]|uniref:crotonase/enoyl-CoA hydratase family protein n=1 Tax=Pseudomonas sp. BF-R-19 TaxID=2832397 RepID=UPI001CBD9325|nr:crotonase/enoyl-CoA hydratase family protein [Pseudomonas sp. BF-R-19]
MEKFLLYEQVGGIVTLTMNQPEVRNALTGNSAIAEFIEACARITQDTSVRVVILTGNGPAFCSGGNVKNMQKYFSESVDVASIRHEYRTGIQNLTRSLYNLEVPVIAAVNGPAIGAGCDLACMCDIRIASDVATFAESFVKIGIVPGDGGAWLLPRVVGIARASEMALTGDALDSQEALACGLISRVVPAEDLMSQARSIAMRIAANPPQAVRMTKRLLREGQNASLDTLLEMSASFQAVAHKSRDHKEAVMAFIEKREPVFVND